MMITAGVPLPVVSETLRPSALGITAGLSSPVTTETAHQPVDSMAGAPVGKVSPDAVDALLRGLDVDQIEDQRV